jgi:hypothetical protein
MPDEQQPKEKPVRFDFPVGASADAIAKALNAARERIMAEKRAKEAEQTPNEDSPEAQK